MRDINAIINKIKDEITRSFPNLDIFLQYISDTDEYFIFVDDKDIFEDDTFLQLVTEINLNIILEENVTNVFLASLPEFKELPHNVSQIYKASRFANIECDYDQFMGYLIDKTIIYSIEKPQNMTSIGAIAWKPQQELALAA